MADAPATGGGQITGSIPFFKQPEPLAAERHAKYGVKRVDGPLKFASTLNVMPLTVGEFGPAALTYPIIFAGDDKAPLVVMGLREGENLFINDDGKPETDVYIPAYVRRYPFVFAEDKEQDRFVVCVDMGSDLVSEEFDTPFFENGQPSAFTNDAVEFLKNYEGQRRASQQLVKLLADKDLFEVRDVTFRPRLPNGSEGDPQKVAEHFAVSTDKLNALSGADLADMQKSGALAAIYAHQISLQNWQTLIMRSLRNAPAQAA